MVLYRPRLRGWGRPNPLFIMSPIYCHISYVPCAIRGAIFAIDVENGLETKEKMTTIADEEYSSQSHGSAQYLVPSGVIPKAKNRKGE